MNLIKILFELIIINTYILPITRKKGEHYCIVKEPSAVFVNILLKFTEHESNEQYLDQNVLCIIPHCEIKLG